MAVAGPEIQIVAGGTEERPGDRGSWVQNLWMPKGKMAWETRPGFGQMAQFGTTLSTPPSSSSGAFKQGIRKHLGSSSVTTSWGATHIVSVFLADAQTGDNDGSGNATVRNVGKWGTYYAVSFYDTGSDARWEEILHHHTSELSDSGISMDAWRGCYETNQTYDRQKFVAAVDDPFYFHVHDNTLFFGNSFTGLLVYFPADFRETRRQTVRSDNSVAWTEGHSESSLLVRLVPVAGLTPESFNYLGKTSLPSPVDLASLHNRFIVAGEHEIFFSDPGVPNAFIDRNFVTLPSERSITALATVGDNLLVFTDRETFLYQPSVGEVASDGQFVTVSSSVGCLGPSAVASNGAITFWADRNGVYSTGNGLSFNEISAPIREFFVDGITSPLNHYLTDSGTSDPISSDQPRTLLSFGSGEMASLAFVERTGALYLCDPSNRSAWCFTSGGWSLWNLESSAKEEAGASVVGAVSNIDEPYFVSNNVDLFCIGSIDEETFVDAGSSRSTTLGSYYILELGRGGSLDRSLKNEDQRDVAEYFTVSAPGMVPYGGSLYFGRPVLDGVSNEYFMRIDIAPDTSTGISSLLTNVALSFTFDNVRWSVKNTAGVLDPSYPHERIGSIAGYTATVVGNLITINYAGAAMNMASNQRNPYFILRWSPLVPSAKSFSFGINILTSGISDGVSTLEADVYVWNKYVGPLKANDVDAQSVDWAYKSAQLGFDGAGQIRARGLFSQIISHGSATAKIAPNWLWGVFNTLSAGDWKEWTSQVVDFTGSSKAIDDIANKLTVRARMKDSSGNLASRTFNNAATFGGYLVDDEEADTIAISDSSRGEHISYMLFGFLRNKAEKIVLIGSKAAIRPGAGGRRRTGR